MMGECVVIGRWVEARSARVYYDGVDGSSEPARTIRYVRWNVIDVNDPEYSSSYLYRTWMRIREQATLR